jgi:cell fate (sporulation/competence/biofilm development) regulator YmcA (YheA/YmcA/DUF963 family)
MRVIIKMIENMDMVNFIGKVETTTRAIIKAMRGMDMVKCIFRMELFIKEIGLEDYRMVEEL